MAGTIKGERVGVKIELRLLSCLPTWVSQCQALGLYFISRSCEHISGRVDQPTEESSKNASWSTQQTNSAVALSSEASLTSPTYHSERPVSFLLFHSNIYLIIRKSLKMEIEIEPSKECIFKIKYARRENLKNNLKHHQPPPIFYCLQRDKRRCYIYETETDLYVKGKFKK